MPQFLTPEQLASKQARKLRATDRKRAKEILDAKKLALVIGLEPTLEDLFELGSQIHGYSWFELPKCYVPDHCLICGQPQKRQISYPAHAEIDDACIYYVCDSPCNAVFDLALEVQRFYREFGFQMVNLANELYQENGARLADRYFDGEFTDWYILASQRYADVFNVAYPVGGPPFPLDEEVEIVRKRIDNFSSDHTVKGRLATLDVIERVCKSAGLINRGYGERLADVRIRLQKLEEYDGCAAD